MASISLINKKNGRDLRRVLDRRGLSPGLDWGDDLHTHIHEHTYTTHTGVYREERKERKMFKKGGRFLVKTPPCIRDAPPFVG